MKTIKDTAWQEYEREIEQHFRTAYPQANVKHNAHVFGRNAKTKRQIDILIEAQALDYEFRIVVEAKRHKRRVDVATVEAFITKLRDVEAHLGILVCPAGYTPAAQNAARNGGEDISLEILNMADLSPWQGACAIPYSRENGACLLAPLGWIFDGSKQEGMLASMYPRGTARDSLTRGFMYINFWPKIDAVDTLDELLSYQGHYLISSPDDELELLPGVTRKERSIVRCFAKSSCTDFTELTDFLEFRSFILMCVMLSPREMLKENISRVRFVLSSALEIQVTDRRSISPSE